jgi:cell division septal protein FtsQ
MRAPAPARPTLLVPRTRPGRAVDVATRETFIAKQRGRGRGLRRLRRALRFAGAGLTTALVVLALAVTGVTGTYAIRTTPLLAVSEVNVIGARRVPEPTVRSAAGIEPGANLLALDLAAVADRVEALPGVRRARAVRHLPNRLDIWLQEREPFALVNASGSRREARLAWVDADGRLVGLERAGPPPLLPILSGVEAPPPDAEHPIGDRLQLGLTLLRAVQRAGGRVVTRISEIDVERPEGPVLYTVDGAMVWLGSERWEERLARLDGVLGELEERGERVETVDLRYRDLVVLKPKPPATAGAPKGR